MEEQKKEYEIFVDQNVELLKAKVLRLQARGARLLNPEETHRLEKYRQRFGNNNHAYVLRKEGIQLLLLKKDLKMVTLFASFEELENKEV